MKHTFPFPRHRVNRHYPYIVPNANANLHLFETSANMSFRRLLYIKQAMEGYATVFASTSRDLEKLTYGSDVTGQDPKNLEHCLFFFDGTHFYETELRMVVDKDGWEYARPFITDRTVDLTTIAL